MALILSISYGVASLVISAVIVVRIGKKGLEAQSDRERRAWMRDHGRK